MEAAIIAIAGFAGVCTVMTIFVVLARFLAPRILGRNDGSSL